MAETIEADASGADRIYRRIFMRIVPFLMLCYFCAYLDRVNVGFAKLQMASELHLSETVYGLGAGVFFLGYVLFEVPSNVILHRIGARVWIARIMITWGVLSGLFALVHTVWQFYLLRFLLGVAEAGLSPGILLFLTYWFPSFRRARIIVFYFLAIPLSGIVGGPLSGWIIEALNGHGGLSGWRWMFFLEAIPTVVVGLLVTLVLRNGVDHARWLTPDEKRIVKAEIAADDRSKVSHASAGAFLRDRRIWLLAAIYFTVVVGQYALTFWLPTLVRRSGVVSPLHIGLLTALPYLCAMGAMLLLGRSGDRHRERRWHLAAPMVAGAVGLALAAALGGNVLLSMAALCLAAAGILGASSIFWMLPTTLLGGVTAAAGIATINSLANIGGFVSPYLIGWITDATGTSALGMYLIAGLIVLAAALVLRVPAALVNR